MLGSAAAAAAVVTKSVWGKSRTHIFLQIILIGMEVEKHGGNKIK